MSKAFKESLSITKNKQKPLRRLLTGFAPLKMETKNRKNIFYFSLILTIALLLPFFLTAQEEIILTLSVSCLGSAPRVNLTWTSTISGNPDFYILRKIEGELTYTEIAVTGDLFYTDTDVKSDRNYLYQIKVVKGAETYYSDEKPAPAAYCKPILLPPIASCQVDGPHINLEWSSISGDLSTYEVWRNETRIYSTTATTFDDGPNIEGTKDYNYFIKAIWQNGNSTTSDKATTTALACPPTLTLTADCAVSSPGGPKAELSWNSLLGVQNYQIYRKAQTEAVYSLLTTLSSTTTNYTDYLVESLSITYFQGGQVFYYVKAIWSTDEKNSTSQQINIPRCPPFLTVKSVCSEEINPQMELSWTATKDATHYNVYRWKDGNFEFLTQIFAPNTSYIDGLTSTNCPGAICTHTYKVDAIVTALPVIPSNSVTQGIDCATVIPPSPTPVLAEPQLSCVSGDSRISLSWTPSNNVVYYTIYRNGVGILNLTNTSYADSGVQSDYNYTYYIVAYGKAGTNSGPSNSWTKTAVDCAPPSTPSLTLSTGCQTGLPYVNLSWTITTNTFSYDIYGATSTPPATLLKTLEFASTTWNDTNVQTSKTYYYKVVANGPAGVIPSSSGIKSITTPSCLPTTPTLTLTRACESGIPVVNLSWTTDKANTTRYEVFREDYSTTSSIFWTSDLSVKTWKDDTGLSPEASYKYKVEAVGYGDPPPRATQGYQSITTYNCALPGAFTLTLDQTYCQGSYPRADLSWTTSTNSTSYDLLRNRLNLDDSIAETATTSNVVSPYTDFGFVNALSFDGSYDYVNIPNAESLNPTRITLEAWIYPTAFNYYGNIFNKRGPEQYILRLYGYTGRVQGYIYSGGGWRACTTPSNIAVSLNRWNHIVQTFDGSTGRVHVNGVLGCTYSYTGNIAAGTSPLRIGTYYTYQTTSKRFKGMIDEVRIYNRALSATEVNDHYQGIFPSAETGLVGLWHFNEGAGQIVSDSSNYGNNGTQGGSTAIETFDPTWIQNGLQSETKYNWQAKANGPGGSTLSNTTTPALMPLCPPTKPGLVLTTTCLAEGMPVVNGSFSFSINASSYEIYREDKGLIQTIPQTVDPSLRTFADTDVSPSTSYKYWVKAIGTGGVTESDHLSITTLACLRPTKPENLQATFACGGTGNSYPRVNLSWDASANASYYTIYRTPTAAPFPVTTSLTSYTDTAVTVDTTYTYNVVAFASGGLDSSSSDSVITTTGYCTPSTPSITSLTTGCESSAPVNTIAWSDATTFNTNSYKIYRNTTGASPPETDLIKTITSADSEFSSRTWKDNLGLSPLNTYYYWVKAIGPTGESALSSSKSISTYSCGIIPSTPTLNLDNLFCSDNLPYATLSWTASTNAYSYNLYRDNLTDGIQSVYSNVLSPKLDGPLGRGKSYKYYVKAFGVDTESSPSNEISLIAPSCLPAKPDLSVTPQCEGGNSQLKLSWPADSNTLSWTIHKKREGESWDLPPFPITTTNVSYSDEDVESDVNYEYYVTAVGKAVWEDSDLVTSTAPFCYLSPLKPVITTATSTCVGYSTRIFIDWGEDASGNTITFNIWRKNITDGEADFSQIYVGLVSSITRFTDGAVQEAKIYSYKVEAVGSGPGNTVFSDQSAEVMTFACSKIPPFPPNLYLNFIYSVAPTIAVSIGWTDAGNEEEYKVFRRVKGESEFALENQSLWQRFLRGLLAQISLAAYEYPLVTLEADILNYVDYTITDGVTYEYQLMASNINGDTLSNITEVFVPIARPGDFTLFWSWVDNTAQIYLNWTKALTTEAGGTVTYQVQRDDSNSFTSITPICSVTCADLDCTAPPLECYDNTPLFFERYYRVGAINNGGTTYSNTIEIDLAFPIWKEIAP